MRKFLENLGDASPLEYGGFFVYEVDEKLRNGTVEYWDEPTERGLNWVTEPPENAPESWTPHPAGMEEVYKVYRFDLERFKMERMDDTLYMVPIQYREDWPRPITAYRPWFVTRAAWDRLCESCEADPREMEDALCSEDPLVRAQVYRMIGEYHGFENLDSYPVEFSRKEMEVRYADELAELSARRCGRGKA